jgi:hypothetical protein
VIIKGDLDALRAPIREIHVTIEAPPQPAQVIKQLGLPPSWKEADALSPIYEAASALARAIATRASPSSRGSGEAEGEVATTPEED